MSIVNFPAYLMYWADETRYAPIADLTSINWYQPLREYLQVKDDLKLDKPPNKSIILCQIHPVQDHVSKNCRYIKPEMDNNRERHQEKEQSLLKAQG